MSMFNQSTIYGTIYFISIAWRRIRYSYYYHLIFQDSTEYTGLEYWIVDKVDKEDITWFPIVGGDAGDDIGEKFD
jgi:hypothetical protein